MEYDARRDENGDERTQLTNLEDQEHAVYNNHMMPVYPVQPDDSDNNSKNMISPYTVHLLLYQLSVHNQWT